MSRVITTIKLKSEHNQEGALLIIGAECDYGRVAKLSFRNDDHKTTGSVRTPCYVVTLVNSSVQMVIPRENVRYVLTDEAPDAPADENIANIPQLPD